MARAEDLKRKNNGATIGFASSFQHLIKDYFLSNLYSAQVFRSDLFISTWTCFG